MLPDDIRRCVNRRVFAKQRGEFAEPDRSRNARRFAVVLCAAFAGAQAHAQTGPVIVIPGKVGVATTINGVIVDGER